MTNGRKFGIIACSLAALVIASAAAPLRASSEEKAPTGLKISKALNLSGYTEFYGASVENDKDTFSVRRARFTLGGEIMKHLRYKVMVDLTKSSVLNDAIVEYVPSDIVGVRVGQFLVPFSLESVTSVADLETVNRSRAVDRLSPGRDNDSTGRDVGLAVFGRWSFIEYTVAVLNGSGINKKDDNDRKDYAGRVVFRPFKFLSFGGSIYRGNKFLSAADPVVKRDREGLEVSASWRMLIFRSEYIHASDVALSRSGFYAMAGGFVIPGKLQIVARYDAVDMDRTLAGDTDKFYVFGANWVFAGRTKVQLNYELQRPGLSGTDNSGVYAQFQVAF